MNRRFILQSLIAGMAMETGTTVSGADDKREGFLVGAGEDRGKAEVTIAKCKLSGKDTGGALAVFGGDPHIAGGVPLHIHHDQDECWYVIEGEHLFQVGDKKFRAKAGDAVFGPRGVPHSPRQLSERGVVLTVFQPAGTMEEFFHELAEAARRTGKLPPPNVLAGLFKANGMQIVGPMLEIP